MTDFKAHDTGPGSAAQGGKVNAHDIAGRDAQTFNINPPPPPDGDRLGWLTDTAYRTASDVAFIYASMGGVKNDVKDLRRDVDHNRIVLFGNGDERAGLVERVRGAWKWIPVAVIVSVVSILLTLGLLLVFVFGGG